MSTLLVLLALVFALAFLAMIVFVAVVVSIHSESRDREMTIKARGPLSVLVRRFLGVYVGRPTDADTSDHREECLTGQSTEWWNRGGPNQ